MNTNIKHLLMQYITGNASSSEVIEAKEWIAKNEENEKEFIQLYEAWHGSLAAHHDLIDPDKAYARFQKENTNNGKSNYKYILGLAASLLLISFAGLFFYNKHHAAATQWNEIVVAKGKTQKITLPDGTLVFINAGSSFKYNSDFGAKDRNVILDGEARFDIAKSKNNIPFIVNAAGFTIRDIGTIFNVRAYKEDKAFETSVLEGEVSVEGKISGQESEESKVFVSANQLVRIKQNTRNQETVNHTKEQTVTRIKPLQIIDIPRENQDEYNGWMNDIVAFNDTGFDDISRALDRKFNVNIMLEDAALSEFHYTGTFKNPEDVFKILNIIKQTTPITYSTKGKNIMIKMKTNL